LKAEDIARKNPQFFAAYNLLGVCAVSKGDLVRAEARFRKAIALNARFLEAQVNLALCLLRQSKVAERRPILQSALRLGPEDPRVLLNLGKVQAASGDFESAIRHLQHADLRSPGNGEIQTLLAEALVETQRIREATPLLETVIRNPNKPETLVRAVAAAF